jgi:hypothetical protein
MRIAAKNGVLAAALVVTGAGCACGQQAAPAAKASAANAPAAKKPAVKATIPVKFLFDYQGEGDANVERDPEFEPLLRKTLPQPKFFWYGTTLAKGIDTYLNVSTGRVTVDDGRYAEFTGCVAHMCDSTRGLLWVDTGSTPPYVLFAAEDQQGDPPTPGGANTDEVYIYGSRQLTADANHAIVFPDDFVKTFHKEMGETTFASATFVEPNGKQISIAQEQSLQLTQAAPTSGSTKGTP